VFGSADAADAAGFDRGLLVERFEAMLRGVVDGTPVADVSEAPRFPGRRI